MPFPPQESIGECKGLADCVQDALKALGPFMPPDVSTKKGAPK